MDLKNYCKELEKRIEILEKQIESIICNDLVTGFPNQKNFYEHVELILAQARRYNLTRSILIISIDSFDKIISTYGEKVADEFTKQAGQRLKTTLRDTDFIAVLQKGEFGIILGNPEKGSPLTVAYNVKEAMIKPFFWGKTTIDLNIKIGIAIFPDDGEDSELLIQHARNNSQY